MQQIARHFALLQRCIERCFAHIGAHGALLVGIGLKDGGAQFIAAGGHVGGQGNGECDACGGKHFEIYFVLRLYGIGHRTLIVDEIHLHLPVEGHAVELANVQTQGVGAARPQFLVKRGQRFKLIGVGCCGQFDIGDFSLFHLHHHTRRLLHAHPIAPKGAAFPCRANGGEDVSPIRKPREVGRDDDILFNQSAGRLFAIVKFKALLRVAALAVRGRCTRPHQLMVGGVDADAHVAAELIVALVDEMAERQLRMSR